MQKSITLLLLIMAICSVKAQVTISTYPCGIKYTYDDAGNRIMRTLVLCPQAHHRQANPNDNNVDTTVAEVELDMLAAPNPTTGKVVLTFNNELDNALVTVINNNGQQMYSAKVSGVQVPLDLSGYSPGVYFVFVQVDKKVFTNTVVKQNR